MQTLHRPIDTDFPAYGQEPQSSNAPAARLGHHVNVHAAAPPSFAEHTLLPIRLAASPLIHLPARNETWSAFTIAHLPLVQLRCPVLTPLVHIAHTPLSAYTAPPTPDAEYVASAPVSASRRGDTKGGRRPTSGVDMRTEGTVRLVSIRNRHTLAHDFHRQGDIPCCAPIYTELVCVPRRRSMHETCTHGSPCLPTIPPAAALFSFSSSSTASFARWGLIRIERDVLLHAHAFSAYRLRMHAHTYAHDGYARCCGLLSFYSARSPSTPARVAASLQPIRAAGQASARIVI
ncbi:hypothetical protein B0H17DRAFT_1334076 [Mycena rosella]|uniref:Uncharacterized protein n=1 Tax=Mycena rosella TaxID=1033263 RepID=A0AAD7D4F0_MYCRO|nr:hypothetical protein B0H17DRAFT_1334076 [Mycena rosella]